MADVARAEVAGEQHWTARLGVLSAASAIAVSVIYLPQSLLTDMAANLGATPAAASIIATTVQAGYALGILLFVPLADRFHPRRQVTVQGIVLVVALLASALLPGVAAVAIGFLVVGLVANIAQVIIPAANRLSPVHRRGATTGALVGAILIGIFGGRIVSSLLVGALGWRWVVVVFAVLVAAMLPFLRRALDSELPLEAAPRSYGRLLLSTLSLAGRSRPLLQSALMQFFVFATFNSIWTVMVLHLTAPPYSWSVLAAGLFGLVGLAAGIVTPLGGRFIDRFGPLPVAGVSLAAMVLATASILIDSKAVIPFAITMFVATWANQTVLSGNQNRSLVSNPHSTAQANTLFMFVVFLGGSVGAFLGPLAYSAGGMPRVALQGLVFTLVAGVLWIATAAWERRTTAAARASRLAAPEASA